RPITDNAMDARQPSWSPDGTHIAFQAYRTTTWQIWIIRPDGTDLQPLTAGPYDDREPVWSPDGRQIAFSSDRSGSYDVWTLTLATRDLKQVTTDPSNEFYPSWHGANEIVFVSDRRPDPGVYAVALAGSNASARLLAREEGAVAAPAFALDGFSLAYSVVAGSRSRLMVADGRGTARNIADADEDIFPFHPQWSSGNQILYTADGRIKRRPAAGGPPQPIEFSADLSSTRPPFRPGRCSFDVAGRRPVRGIVHPAVSPDGTQVAFAAIGDLWRMPIGGAPERLTHDPSLETDPAWSPDGASLAYSSDRDGFMNIWVRDLRSGIDRQITHGSAAAMNAAWSPDGSRIAFSDPEGQIQIADIKNGTVTKAHDHLNEAGRASWSPDGRALVVSSLKVYSTRFREGTNQVLRIELGRGPDRWFAPMPHKSIGMREDYGPAWSPDGSRMAAIVDGLLATWPVAADGAPTGPPRPVATDLAGS